MTDDDYKYIYTKRRVYRLPEDARGIPIKMYRGIPNVSEFNKALPLAFSFEGVFFCNGGDDGAMFDRIPSTNAVPQAPFKRLKRAGKGERPFVQGNMSITRSKAIKVRRFKLVWPAAALASSVAPGVKYGLKDL